MRNFVIMPRMPDIASTLSSIKVLADEIGLAELAREAGVPYTTLRSFAERDWSHKNLEMVERLANVVRLRQQQTPGQGAPSVAEEQPAASKDDVSYAGAA